MSQHINSCKAIPTALENFDTLPDSAFVAQPVVEGLFGISPSTIWRRVKDATLPTPQKFGPRCTRWNVGALRRARGVNLPQAA